MHYVLDGCDLAAVSPGLLRYSILSIIPRLSDGRLETSDNNVGIVLSYL